jgi:hypothetical protein
MYILFVSRKRQARSNRTRKNCFSRKGRDASPTHLSSDYYPCERANAPGLGVPGIQAYHPQHHELAARLQCLDKSVRGRIVEAGSGAIFCYSAANEGHDGREGWAVNGVLGPWLRGDVWSCDGAVIESVLGDAAHVVVCERRSGRLLAAGKRRRCFYVFYTSHRPRRQVEL